MRTEQEIIDRIRFLDKEDYRDFLGTQQTDLINYLSFDAAMDAGFLKESATGDDWYQLPQDCESVREQISGYMDFAWDKANNCRGISAGRSLDHMKAWVWMLGHDTTPLEDYTHYGKPQLRAICEHFNMDWRQWDDGEWCNYEGDDGVPPDKVDKVALGW